MAGFWNAARTKRCTPRKAAISSYTRNSMTSKPISSSLPAKATKSIPLPPMPPPETVRAPMAVPCPRRCKLSATAIPEPAPHTKRTPDEPECVSHFQVLEKSRLQRRPAQQRFLHLRAGLRGQKRGHFTDHRQHQAFITIGKSGAIFLDLREETDFVLRKFTQHLLGFLVARRFRAGEKVGQRDFHGFGDFGQGLERRNSVAVLDAGEIATQQTGAALDVSLRQATLAAVSFYHFTNVDLWFLFWHGFPQSHQYLSH